MDIRTNINECEYENLWLLHLFFPECMNVDDIIHLFIPNFKNGGLKDTPSMMLHDRI